MKKRGPHPSPYQTEKKYIVLSIPIGLPRVVRNLGLLVIVVAGSNYLTYRFTQAPTSNGGPQLAAASNLINNDQLYLLDKAQSFVADIAVFGDKVEEIAQMLEIPAEWLMAVMYAESKFDASVFNHKGSGAVGLIQFMQSTALELNVSTERLSKMDHLQQLEYVYLYLQNVRDKYGNYQSLTDLYLGILYPRARNQDECYTLYAKPSKAYYQNSGLDENRDGQVTISDIDRRLARLFPTAYQLDSYQNKPFPN